MKNGLSMAIIGAGISGLSLAASLMRHSSLHVTLLEKQIRLGGRVFTSEVAPNVFADLGANIIDFQDKNQENKIRQFLSRINSGDNSKLQLFREPFLIYEKDELRKGDYQKQRFYYENGFKQLISDLQAYLSKYQQRCTILNNARLQTIGRSQSKWIVRDYEQKLTRQFDFVVLSCNGHGIAEILKASSQETFANLSEQVGGIKYTKQISLAFEIAQAQYSSILFKNHPITFISSHIEKYPHQKPLIVMQTNEAFSEKYFDQEEEKIQTHIRELIPSFLEKDLGKCLKINKWWPSLIRQKRAKSSKEKFQVSQSLFVVGDIFAGASRVANAIESSLILSSYFESMMEAKL